MPKGSLADMVTKCSKQQVSEWTYTAKYIALYEITAGMRYLHLKRVVHCDLKPENVLLDDNLDQKITDFGLSKTMFLRRTVIQSHLAGSLPYMAPEVLEQNEHYTQEVDIYSSIPTQC
jgi:serine/threonine protein kinase